MSEASITIQGDKRLMRALKRLDKDAQKQVGKAVDATALEVRGDIVKGYNKGPATGRVYRRGKGRNLSATHQASAPGEAPMTDTGRLANSVTFKSTGPLSAEVGSEVKYGPFLEFGTRHIAKRPLWVPVSMAAAKKFKKRVEAYLRKAMR